MSKLIILRGNSGSGKTTVARALQRKFGRNTMVISQDTIRREMLWVRDYEGNPAIALMINLLKYGRKNSDITILEGILYSDIYKSLFETAIEQFGEDIHAYYYEIPFEETLLRHGTKPNRFNFGEEHMRKWWKEKDYLGIIPEKTLTKELSFEDAVEMIYYDVR